jgi:two-component system chemotaxis response regulator CheB
VIRVLIVDDSPLMRRLLGGVLGAEDGFEVAYARDGVEALEQVRDFAPDVITLDIEMPRMDGLTCLDRIMIDHPRPVVMVSSQTTAGAEATLRAMALGAVDFMPKPRGPISLEIDELAPILVEKITLAAKARLPRAHRLVERVRARTARIPVARPPAPRRPAPVRRTVAGSGPGAVLIGSSTGGPPALDALVSGLPADFPLPVLVAQHMPASFTGPLARRLDTLSALSVMEVTEPVPIAPGQIYIGRGEADLVVARRPAGLVAMAAPASAEYRWHPSVDRMVDSAMRHYEACQLIGVLMTGMGNDGAAEMSRLHLNGGYAIAESEETAVIWGMPGELVKAGGADAVLPLDAIARHLVALAGAAP